MIQDFIKTLLFWLSGLAFGFMIGKLMYQERSIETIISERDDSDSVIYYYDEFMRMSDSFNHYLDKDNDMAKVFLDSMDVMNKKTKTAARKD